MVPQRYIAPLSLVIGTKAYFLSCRDGHRPSAKVGYTMQIFLIAAQISVLLVIGILAWQIWRKFKSIPDDEVIGEERAKYMTRRLKWIALCVGLEAVLSITSAVLRVLEII